MEPDERGVGDLVVTTLTNDYMPLLRYRIGDLAERCEQPYATDYLVHGRARDTLRGRDGRRVTTLEVDQCFADAPASRITNFARMKAAIAFCATCPTRPGPTKETLSHVTSQLAALLKSPSEIKIEPMDVLVPSSSGKFRLTSPAA